MKKLMTSIYYKPLHIHKSIFRKNTEYNYMFNAKTISSIAYETQLNNILNKIYDMIQKNGKYDTLQLNWTGEIFSSHIHYLTNLGFDLIFKENLNISTISWSHILSNSLKESNVDFRASNNLYKIKDINFQSTSIEYEICAKAITGHTEYCFHHNIRPQTIEYLKNLGFSVIRTKKENYFVTIVSWLDTKIK